jgi:hypothetical protein
MRRTLVLFLAVASCLSALPQKALTNDDIIKMVKGGLSDDVILLAIETQPSNFDISVQALIELKQQGASKAVLDKILEVAAARHRAAAPPSQAQPQVTPPANAAVQALSPADEQRVRSLVEHAVSQSRRLLAQPMEQNLHELLDQGLSGGDLPAPFKASFVALFAPYRQALHQFLDQEAGRLRQQLNKPSGPRYNLKGPSPFLRPVLWTEGKVFPNEVGPDHMIGGEWRSASRPYRDPSLWLLNSQPACGENSTSDSGTVGDGVTVTINSVEWVDTPDSIGSGREVERVITVDPKVPAQGGKSGKQSSSITSRECVNRCPTADGKVAGKSEFGWGTVTEVTATTGAVGTDRDVTRQDVTAEGHVGDDARVREVVVQADWSVEKRVDPGPSMITRWRGTATFDPHASEDSVPLQLTSCSGNQGVLPLAQCAGGARVFVNTLRDAYLRAERKWNYMDPEYGERDTGGSKCVIVKFTPPTRTVKASPRQSVPVKAELIAVKGNQPTWGVFDDLTQIPGGFGFPCGSGDGEIREDGTRTSPDAPAQLTYTAPSKQWPLNEPPGFCAYHVTSRAGAINGELRAQDQRRKAGLEPDDWMWFLAPGLRLSIHERAEANLGVSSYLSEVTFPMDLNVNEKRQVVGQAVVPREGRSLTMRGFCQGVDHWTEQWHVSGTLDEKTDTFTLKLWIEAGPKQGVNTCKGPAVGSDGGPVVPPGAPVGAPYAVRGFRSDAFPSPLDRFTLPAKEGAKQHFVIPLGPAKHTIDLTLVPPQG